MVVVNGVTEDGSTTKVDQVTAIFILVEGGLAFTELYNYDSTAIQVVT